MSQRVSTIALAMLLWTVSTPQNEITAKKGERMYKKITTNLMVDNVGETLDFYEGVLGFSLVMAVPENSQAVVTTREDGTPLDFAIVKRDGAELMFQSRKSFLRELPLPADRSPGGTITLYIEVASAKELYENIKDKVTIVKDLRSTFYGMQEFYIRDCNGYVLTFASRQQEDAA
jgi:uncharacterized glyoxalase superfamily protein PhnB